MPFPYRWLAERRGREVGTARRRRPPPGCCQSLVCYQERFLVLFGGGSLHHFTNDVYVFDMNCRSWTCRQPENSDIVAPRLGHTAVLYKDTMIVYGGQDLHSPVVYDDVLQLDLVTWRWSLLHRAPPYPEGPGARRLHCAHVIADCMYVVLGAPSDSDASLVWALDLTSGVWRDMRVATTATTGLPPALNYPHHQEGHGHPDAPPPLCGCCSAVSGESIYVFGGYHAEEERRADYAPSMLSYVHTLYEFNVQRNAWRLVRPARPFPLPPSRYAAAMAVHHNCVYIFGGDANQDNLAWYFDDVWRMCLDITHGSAAALWERVPVAGSGPSARSGCAYAYAKSSLYVVGGEMGPMELLQNESYSDELFALPLGYSCALTLRDSVARWIGLPAPQQALTSLYPAAWPNVRLSLGARQALEPYTHC